MDAPNTNRYTGLFEYPHSGLLGNSMMSPKFLLQQLILIIPKQNWYQFWGQMAPTVCVRNEVKFYWLLTSKRLLNWCTPLKTPISFSLGVVDGNIQISQGARHSKKREFTLIMGGNSWKQGPIDLCLVTFGRHHRAPPPETIWKAF